MNLYTVERERVNGIWFFFRKEGNKKVRSGVQAHWACLIEFFIEIYFNI